MRKKYLVGYGLGGCWPGYKNACVIEATDDTIKDVAFDIASTYWHSKDTNSGLSYDWEEVETVVNNCSLYKSRLHVKGKAMVNELPFVVHSMGKTFLAKQIVGLKSTNTFLESNKEYGVIHANYAHDLYLVALNDRGGIKEAELSSKAVAGHITL